MNEMSRLFKIYKKIYIQTCVYIYIGVKLSYNHYRLVLVKSCSTNCLDCFFH